MNAVRVCKPGWFLFLSTQMGQIARLTFLSLRIDVQARKINETELLSEFRDEQDNPNSTHTAKLDT